MFLSLAVRRSNCPTGERGSSYHRRNEEDYAGCLLNSFLNLRTRALAVRSIEGHLGLSDIECNA